jgi:hypothetical protein
MVDDEVDEELEGDRRRIDEMAEMVLEKEGDEMSEVR